MYRQELEQSAFGIPFIGLILKDMEFSSLGIFIESTPSLEFYADFSDDMVNLSQLTTFYNSSVKLIEKFQLLNGKSKPHLTRQRSLLGTVLKVGFN